tara:strand:+ start:170 stop:403 length:234 start_codon:yes stop_codon:yes gene_type:complete
MAGIGLGIGVSLASIARLAASTTAIQLGITGTDLITQDGRNLITQDGKSIHTSPIYLVNQSGDFLTTQVAGQLIAIE